jgi:hypothetical protein
MPSIRGRTAEEDGTEISQPAPYCIQWWGRTVYPEELAAETRVRADFATACHSLSEFTQRKSSRRVSYHNRNRAQRSA